MVVLPQGAFLLMRHGQTRANASDVVCGSTDLPLNETGQHQARETAEFLRGTSLARIVTSPLLRARQTAQAVAEVTGLPPEQMVGLAERNWGAWEGEPRAVLQRDATPPGGESPAAFARRVTAAFAQIDLGAPTLIVCHAGTARAIHAHLTDTPPSRLENAQLVLWRRAGHRWRCHECFKPSR